MKNNQTAEVQNNLTPRQKHLIETLSQIQRKLILGQQKDQAPTKSNSKNKSQQ